MQRRAKGRHDDVEANTPKEATRKSSTRRLADLALALVAAGLLYAAARSGASTPNDQNEMQQPLAKVFAFHRDEEFLLGDWLYWHCAVFGCSNVVVMDHASTNPKVLAILEAYKTRGVTVETFRGAFGEKAEALSRAMRARADEARLLVPLDVDEFVVLEADQGFVADARRIRAAFAASASSNEMRKFKFSSRVAACPAPADDGDALGGGLHVVSSGNVVADAAKRPAVVRAFSPPTQTAMAKTFFRGGPDFLETDQGNHFGKIRRDNASSQDAMIDNRNFDRFFARTPLTLLHFSMPDFDTWYAKVLQRAKAYKFTMATQCAGVRRGQRYCRSFQKLRGGAAPREIARTEYADVCGAIAAQQRETGGARQRLQGGLGSLADVLLRRPR
ncbi:unnamed protein product [Pelagomonas calceolata]|uniref:Glycosyltransferase family 92 protein n=1 Tax=Pelagomonas calceolata TaxID=35677 RepID=A0A7S4E2M3_9STRA|nr:unnamed protein product [Pelagomonas calceolata]|mmetsp:Transcript_3880/g.11966  ORF Transcript_3880/g.11966 Transcript_3880/m.11966 type:complete len:389 (+) Transcript_3880:180-1346(+)